MKMNSIALSIIALAVSVLLSSIIISNSLSNLSLSSDTDKEKEQVVMEKKFLNKTEIAQYLGISVKEFDKLDKMQISSFGKGIPYLQTDTNKYFTIQGIEDWLTDTNRYLSNDDLSDN